MLTKVILIQIAILVLLGSSVYAADCIGKRYQDNNDGTVTDCRTGLVWLKNANCNAGVSTWQSAKTWVAGLWSSGTCSLTDGSRSGDWRLPTRTELMAMVESAKMQGFHNPALTDASGKAQATSGNVFSNVQNDLYWTSSTYACTDSAASVINMGAGGTDCQGPTGTHFIWPVRGGQTGSFGSVIVK
jgi:hypothetical protein